MNNARYGHISTVLTNGNLLVSGEYDNNVYLHSAEIYDSSTELEQFLIAWIVHDGSTPYLY
jgi:hypothetical protein